MRAPQGASRPCGWSGRWALLASAGWRPGLLRPQDGPHVLEALSSLTPPPNVPQPHMPVHLRGPVLEPSWDVPGCCMLGTLQPGEPSRLPPSSTHSLSTHLLSSLLTLKQVKREILVEVLTKRKTVTVNDKLILPYSLSEVSPTPRGGAVRGAPPHAGVQGEGPHPTRGGCRERGPTREEDPRVRGRDPWDPRVCRPRAPSPPV